MAQNLALRHPAERRADPSATLRCAETSPVDAALVELLERALRDSSKSRDTVLDRFSGSSTTLIACEETGCGEPGWWAGPAVRHADVS